MNPITDRLSRTLGTVTALVALAALPAAAQEGAPPGGAHDTNAHTEMNEMDETTRTGTAAGTIVEIAASSGDFETLVAAVEAAGLAETLSGEGPFTVFAPTDDAFGRLPEGTVDELLKPESRAKLTGILTYHVVPGRVTAAEVVKLTSAETASGGRVAIRASNGSVMVNDATVVKADIIADNGVIHVIDTVLLPPEE